MERLKKNYTPRHEAALDASAALLRSWRYRPTLRMLEVAELVGVSVDLVQTLIDADKLIIRRIGRIPLIVTDSLIDWVDDNPKPRSSPEVGAPRVTTKHRAEAARLITNVQKNQKIRKEK